MNAERQDAAHAGLSRSPSFTLATALAWLGHDCQGGCPELATEWRASVWFLVLPDPQSRSGTRALVEVNFADCPWSVAHVRRLMRQVNTCVHRDHIRVREGRGAHSADPSDTGRERERRSRRSTLPTRAGGAGS